MENTLKSRVRLYAPDVTDTVGCEASPMVSLPSTYSSHLFLVSLTTLVADSTHLALDVTSVILPKREIAPTTTVRLIVFFVSTAVLMISAAIDAPANELTTKGKIPITMSETTYTLLALGDDETPSRW